MPEQQKEDNEKEKLADTEIDIINDDKDDRKVDSDDLTYLPAVPIPDIFC